MRMKNRMSIMYLKSDLGSISNKTELYTTLCYTRQTCFTEFQRILTHTTGAIWWWRYWSTLTQVMACCLTAPSHYLNQCWLIIKGVHRHSPGKEYTWTLSVRLQITTQSYRLNEENTYINILGIIIITNWYPCMRQHLDPELCYMLHKHRWMWYVCKWP